MPEPCNELPTTTVEFEIMRVAICEVPPPVRAEPVPIPDETIEFRIVTLSISNVLPVESPLPKPGTPTAETVAFSNKSDEHKSFALNPTPGTLSPPSTRSDPPFIAFSVTFEFAHSIVEDSAVNRDRNSFDPSVTKTTELPTIETGAVPLIETPERTIVTSVLLSLTTLFAELPVITRKSPSGESSVPLQEWTV
jgi:hypothetical protein